MSRLLFFIVIVGLFVGGFVGKICYDKVQQTRDCDKKLVQITITEAVTNPISLDMYFAIQKWAAHYDIPLRYAYGIAAVETGYQGPFSWNYDHRQTSCVGALGPMQIMPTTATYINKSHVSNEVLKNNIDYNVQTSMRLLRHLYDLRHSWLLVFGEYNTGRPMINDYAIKVANYQPNWNYTTPK